MAAPAARVIIIGAGLAGIAASTALTQLGFHTILIERRKLLGGRATSFDDATTGMLLDNCQHVLLGCCSNLLHLYEQLGISHEIEFFDTVQFVDERGQRGAVYATPLPSPLHLSFAMLRFGLLTLSEKLQVLRAMMAIMLLDRAGLQAMDAMTFEAFLRDHGQSPRVIDRFWDVLVTSALNERVAYASAKYGIQLFQEAFLGHRDGYRMGLSRVPLAELYTRAGATETLMGTRVMELVLRNDAVTGVRLEDGRTLTANYVILAVAPESGKRLLSTLPLVSLLSSLDHLQFAPIIGAHFWYDRPVMPEPHLALVGTQLQWLFRKDAAGQFLHGVVSAADPLVDVDQDELAKLFDREIRQVLPHAQNATLLHYRIIKEKRATFRPLPGVDAIRPAQHTGIPGLILAGDYTRTDWPATMEGAVRSGYLAAEAILRYEHRPQRLLQSDLRDRGLGSPNPQSEIRNPK